MRHRKIEHPIALPAELPRSREQTSAALAARAAAPRETGDRLSALR
ncbi:hypothetical protein [Nocardia yamanashiensis]|nr:hypothetical protein [Nocardia yamanashiensis]